LFSIQALHSIYQIILFCIICLNGKSIFSVHSAFAVGNEIRYKQHMNSAGSEKRMKVLFTGRVQGVGFRYSVCRIAQDFNVTGYVRNLWDGDVELVAEGTEEELNSFLYSIRNSKLDRYIIQDQISWNKPTGEFDQFGISF